MPDTELAWAAGFFDGEGSTYIKVDWKNYPRLCITISQTYDAQVLVRFRAAVGVGHLYGPRPNRAGNPTWVYTANGRYVDQVLGKLWPYLSDVKRNQYLRKYAEVFGEGVVPVAAHIDSHV